MSRTYYITILLCTRHRFAQINFYATKKTEKGSCLLSESKLRNGRVLSAL